MPHSNQRGDAQSDPGGGTNPWMYVTKEELTSLSSLCDDTVIDI